MGARTKLNAGYAVTSFLIAAFIGGLADSGVVFAIALFIVFGLNYGNGNIRDQANPQQRNQHRKPNYHHKERRK